VSKGDGRCSLDGTSTGKKNVRMRGGHGGVELSRKVGGRKRKRETVKGSMKIYRGAFILPVLPAAATGKKK